MSVTPGGQNSGLQIFQNAATATGNGSEHDVISASSGSYTIALLHVTGSFSATITFQGTVDGSNWFSIEAEDVSDTASRSTTTTSAGAYRLVVIGLKKIRATVTWTSGTSVTVKGILCA